MKNFEHESKQVLILALSGIGNFLMQRPFIQALKENRPAWDLTVWIAPRGVKPLVEITPEVSHLRERNLPRGLGRLLWHGWRLNRQSFDQTIMLSPGQLWKGSLLMALTGAEERLAHRYPHLGNHASSFLLTQHILEQEGDHDIEQNLRLLEPLGIDPTPYLNNPYALELPASYRQKAEALLPDEAKGKVVIGFHPGSSPSFAWKRWPLDNFAELGKALQEKYRAHLLLFGGADEWAQEKELQRKIGRDTTIISSDLLTTTGAITHCDAFVSNDSGLMHVAAAVGTRTYGLFGPTDEKETGPRGSDSHVIRAPGTESVYETEVGSDLGEGAHPTIARLKPAYVAERVSVSDRSSA